jgi:hypothetical protein
MLEVRHISNQLSKLGLRASIAKAFLFLGVSLNVECETFVVDKTARTRKLPHHADLFAVWSQLKLVCLQSQHACTIPSLHS